MQIVIKAIKRNELTLEVDPSTTVKETKMLIEGLTQIPWTRQKLLLVGRNLKDDAPLSDFPLLKTTKMTLVEIREIRPNLPDILQRIYRKHLNDYQSKQMTNKFMAEFDKALTQLSLDDFERLAASFEENKKKTTA